MNAGESVKLQIYLYFESNVKFEANSFKKKQ